MTTIDYTAIGKRIRSARKRAEMTQGRLAEKSGISPSHMSHIETGKTKLSLPVLIDIANALDTTADHLLHDNLETLSQAYDPEFQVLLKDCPQKDRPIIYEVAHQVMKVLKHR